MVQAYTIIVYSKGTVNLYKDWVDKSVGRKECIYSVNPI